MNHLAPAIAAAAQSVKCPTCRAPAGERCRGFKEAHVARQDRGINQARRDEYRAHRHIEKALGRVRQATNAGCTPAAADVTAALGSCGCLECRAATVPLAKELAPWLA